METLRRRQTYSDLILAALRRYPDRVAFVSDDRSVTYREVQGQAGAVAAALTDAGVGRGDGVGMLSLNRPEVFAGLAATLAVGARYTALHPLGSPSDHAFVCEDAELRAVIYDPVFEAQVAAFADRLDGVAFLSLGPSEHGRDVLGGGEEAPELPSVAEESDIAVIAYTGGTTGKPKGVVLSHRSLTTNVFMTLAEWDLPEAVRLLGATPLSHSLGLFVLPVLIRGGTIVLLPYFDPASFLQAIEEQRITATFVVPTMLYALLDHPGLAETDLSSLQTLLYGAAPASPERLEEALKVFGPILMQGYAETEAPNTVTILQKQDHRLDQLERLKSCGKPMAGITVTLLDEHGAEVPTGEVGEICIRGPLVMEGYWKQPDLTEETFRGAWLHTGDIGRFDEDGYLYIVDRAKDMIISGGFNVYPREIEDVLAEHPAVALSAVIGVPDEKWGEAVTAFVVRAPGAEVTTEQLSAFVRERKGKVHAPKRVEFVDQIPLTPVGKIDKKQLRADYWKDRERAVN